MIAEALAERVFEILKRCSVETHCLPLFLVRASSSKAHPLRPVDADGDEKLLTPVRARKATSRIAAISGISPCQFWNPLLSRDYSSKDQEYARSPIPPPPRILCSRHRPHPPESRHDAHHHCLRTLARSRAGLAREWTRLYPTT